MEFVNSLAKLGVPIDQLLLMAIIGLGIAFSATIFAGSKYGVAALFTSAIAIAVTVLMIVVTNTATGFIPGLEEYKAIIQLFFAIVIWIGLTWLGQKM